MKISRVRCLKRHRDLIAHLKRLRDKLLLKRLRKDLEELQEEIEALKQLARTPNTEASEP